MKKWFIVLLIIMAIPFAAYAQVNTPDKAMQAWAQQTFGIPSVNPEIGQDWNSLPMLSGCDYEWHINSKDAMIQIKDRNDNYYRLLFQDNTFTVDFMKAFSGSFWG